MNIIHPKSKFVIVGKLNITNIPNATPSTKTIDSIMDS